jgi:CubicO group peptidase (beta-lactamase class C family)
VQEAFEQNFHDFGELGAAFAVYRDGELVVDLWGGISDKSSGAPWVANTTSVIFSGTKALVAVCMLILLERGLIDLDRPVCDYWPEFRANGKGGILVRDVVSHSARLPGVDTPVSVDDVADDRHMAALLEKQPPSPDPRARLCYHALTYGWLCGELVRRTDGRGVGRFFADEVAVPLGLDLWISLPADREDRVATMELAADWPARSSLSAERHAGDSLLRSIWGNPPLFARDVFPWNTRHYHAAEIPGAGGIGSARSIAKLFGHMEHLLADETLRIGRTTLADGIDPTHDRSRRRFGVGFQLQTEESSLGPAREAFGHSGAGGSIHGAWPEHGIGFSYTMNLMRDDQDVDPRAEALLQALYEAAQ